MFRNRRGRVKHFVLITFLMVPALAMAQDESVDRNADCAAVLAAPPFVDILTRNEGYDFYKISYPENAQKLVGLECSVDELTDFFEKAGWEFLRLSEHYNSTGPFGGSGHEYYSDSSAHYCLKRPTLFGMFDFRCRPYARIDFYQGQISSAGAATLK